MCRPGELLVDAVLFEDFRHGIGIALTGENETRVE